MQSRFRFVGFPDWTVDRCVEHLKQRAKDSTPTAFEIDAEALDVVRSTFAWLKKRPGWANARDAEEMWRMLLVERDQRVAEERNPQRQMRQSMTKSSGLTSPRSRPASSTNTSSTTNRFVTKEDAERTRTRFEQARPEAADVKENRSTTLSSAATTASAPKASALAPAVERQKIKHKEETRGRQSLRENMTQEKEKEVENDSVRETMTKKERLVLKKRISKKLLELGRCPANYGFDLKGDSFVCQGGQHRVSVDELGTTAHQAAIVFKHGG